MPTKGQQTRHKILKTSREVFMLNGFHNTSVSDIIAATGVKKGNLYYHFTSKEALGLAVLSDARDEFMQLLISSLVGKSPLLRVKNSIEAIFQMMQKNNFVGGCLFGNTALEMSDINHEFSDVIAEVFTTWAEMIEEQLVKAQEDGHLVVNISANQLAKLIIASIEGGIMMSRVSKNEKDFEDCIASLNSLIGM